MSAKKQSGTKKSAIPVKQVPKREKELKTAPSFFDKPGKQVWYVLIGVITIVSFIVFRDFLLFRKLFLFKDIGCDSLNIYYPSIIATSEYLKHYGTLSWSFNIGMGQDGTPLAFYDCLNAVLYLFPTSKMVWLLGYSEVIKMIVGGAIFYIYLRQLGNNTFASFAVSLMFAFTGYMIIGGQWFGFAFEAIEIALILLGFELLFQKNIPWLLPLPIFLMGISVPFNIFLVSVFMFVYILFRYIQDNRKGVKGLAILFLKIAGLWALGIAISSPILFEHIKAMLESPRVSGTNSFFASLSSTPILGLTDPVQLGTCVDRFFSSEMLGTADQFKGFGNYLEAPLFYCGLPCLLLVPLIFGYLEKRERKLYGILLAVWLLPIFFPYLRRAFWLFSGDYYRAYSFYVALIFMIISATCLNRLTGKKRMNIILLIVITVALILIQLFPYFDNKNVLNANVASAVKIYILVYAALLFWISRQKSDLPKFIFLFVLITELGWFASLSVNRGAAIKSSEWKEKTGYNDYSVDAVSFIKNSDKSFYRIDKPVGSSPAEFRSLDDAMVQGYYGTSCYNSFNQKYYIQYLLAHGIINPKNESESRWSVGLTGRPILESLNSVKYILSKVSLTPMQRPGYDSLASFGDVIIYKNNFVLPLGFCYDAYIKYSDFGKASVTQKDFISLAAAVVSDSDTGVVHHLKQFNLKDTINPAFFTLNAYREDYVNLKQDTLNISKFSPADITGAISLKAPRILYLSIPYDIGWHLIVDGKSHPIVLISNGMMGVYLSQGDHTVEIAYKPPYRKEGKLLALGGLVLYGGLMYSFYKRRGKTRRE